MGLFGGDDDDSDAADRANQLAQQQIDQQNAELEQKRQNMVQTRMEIIKSTGGEQWTPDKQSSAPTYRGDGSTTSSGTVFPWLKN